jgi:membrane-associated phospholipid phosphatase
MVATRVSLFRRARGRLARFTILSVSLATLILARTGVPVYLLVAAVAISLLGLYGLGSMRRGFGAWSAYLLGFVLFALLRTLADETGVAIKGGYALGADTRLFGGTLPTEWLQHHLYTPGTVGGLELLCAAVYASYFVALLLWWRNPRLFMRYGLSVLVTVYTGLVACLAVPTAPPWLAERYGGGTTQYRILTDVLGRSPEGTDSGVAGANPFAAMPSLHMALTALVVLVAWRRPFLRVPAVLYALLMAFALVYTGEHYVIDELAGLLTAGLAWLVAARLVAARSKTTRAHRVVVAPRAAVEPARGPT